MEDIAGIDPAVVAEVERETSELLSALIQIDTSNPPGDETRVAEFMRDWFAARGLHGEIAGEPADRALASSCASTRASRAQPPAPRPRGRRPGQRPRLAGAALLRPDP